MQRACAILLSVACPALQHFSTLSHKRHDFRKKVTGYKMCVWISLELLSDKFLILRRIVRDMMKFFFYFSSFLSDFNKNLIFCTVFWQIFKYQVLWKTAWWEPSCSILTDGLTEKTKLIVAFRNFANAPKKCKVMVSWLISEWIGQHVEGGRSSHVDILPSHLLVETVENGEKSYSLWILEWLNRTYRSQIARFVPKNVVIFNP
jgi:hypothetical protein